MAANSDMVFIEGLKIDAVIGIFDWERAITQPLLLDIQMLTDIKPAAATDDVTKAINYKAVCDDVTAWTQASKSGLLEHLAEHLAAQILENYDCEQVTIKVSKPTAISAAAAVGVKITRSKA